MDIIAFAKYHGTGNDFILIDNRENFLTLKEEEVSFLCHRRFGIGADGLILLNPIKEIKKNTENQKNILDFEMVYYNSDGKKSSMCGNGGRCIVAFAHALKIFSHKTSFLAIGNSYHANLLNNSSPQKNQKEISIQMNNILKQNIIFSQKENREFFILDTGSPHYVQFIDDIKNINFVEQAKQIRYSKDWEQEGININFVAFEKEKNNQNINKITIRTYERGVEDETYACGTGAVACAIATHFYFRNQKQENQTNLHHKTIVETKGGKLNIFFDETEFSYEKICLSGPTVKVFEGEIKKDFLNSV